MTQDPNSAPSHQSPTESDDSVLKKVGELLVFLTGIGIFTQGIAYVAASGFYRHYSLVPDQLGVTPLNALLRLPLTGIFTGAILLAIVWLLFSRSSPKHRNKAVTRDAILGSVRLIASAGLTAILLLSIAAYFLGRLAATSIDDTKDYGILADVNPIQTDLQPPVGLMRWTKAEEYPSGLLGDDVFNTPRAVYYFGTQNTASYFYDLSQRRMLVVPASQVQASLVLGF